MLISFFSAWFYPMLAGAIYFLVPSSSRPELLCALALLSLLASLLLFHRYRTLQDTAVTSLKSIAQGYVGLTVKAMPIPGDISPGPYDLPPVVWFRRHNAASKQCFILEDEFGHCTIDPKNAHVITPTHERFQKRFKGIFPGEFVYVLGQLKSTSYHRTDSEKRSAILGLLASWKVDQFEMLNRFDKNGDGRIDSQELLLAKDAAESAIESDLDFEYRQPTTHLIEKPNDFRPLIISSIPIKTLIRKYYWGSLLHLVAWLLLSIMALTS